MFQRIIWALLILAVAHSASADAPRTLSYQGELTDLGGAAIVGTQNITFRLYDALSGGSELWSETLSVTTSERGVFEVVLGESATLASTRGGRDEIVPVPVLHLRPDVGDPPVNEIR